MLRGCGASGRFEAPIRLRGLLNISGRKNEGRLVRLAASRK
jgi:hypothetical protein